MIKQIDLLKMLLKGGIQIEYGGEILVWDIKKTNYFDTKGVIVGTITEKTFDMLENEEIIVYNPKINKYVLAIECRGDNNDNTKNND